MKNEDKPLPQKFNLFYSFFNLQNFILLIADVNIPMIRLLLEGGRDCLESVRTSIRSGIPVIVVKVTGCLVNFAVYELAFLALKLNF